METVAWRYETTLCRDRPVAGLFVTRWWMGRVAHSIRLHLPSRGKLLQQLSISCSWYSVTIDYGLAWPSLSRVSRSGTELKCFKGGVGGTGPRAVWHWPQSQGPTGGRRRHSCWQRVSASLFVTGTGLENSKRVLTECYGQRDSEMSKPAHRSALLILKLDSFLFRLQLKEASLLNRLPSCFFNFLFDNMTCFRRHLVLVIYLSASK
jgi:hypothetical protein